MNFEKEVAGLLIVKTSIYFDLLKFCWKIYVLDKKLLMICFLKMLFWSVYFILLYLKEGFCFDFEDGLYILSSELGQLFFQSLFDNGLFLDLSFEDWIIFFSGMISDSWKCWSCSFLGGAEVVFFLLGFGSWISWGISCTYC